MQDIVKENFWYFYEFYKQVNFKKSIKKIENLRDKLLN